LELEAENLEHWSQAVESTGWLRVLDLVHDSGADAGGECQLVLSQPEGAAGLANRAAHSLCLTPSWIEFEMHDHAL
jgi:hypothetical protein